MSQGNQRVGLWLVGACGGVGNTVALGLAALRKGLSLTTGMVTDLPPFAKANLVAPADIVLGGHEVRSQTLLDGVRSLHSQAGLFDAELIKACTPQLRAMQRNICPGTLVGTGPHIRKLVGTGHHANARTPAEAIARLTKDIKSFQRTQRLEQVVVVHVASAEPKPPKVAAHESYAKLVKALGRAGSRILPSSSIYALAAIEAGCAFVNFTPSTGAEIPAIRERADELGVPYMGRDGKTGETLVKSALAPMFATRNLNVLSWIGKNILGNHDGAALRDAKTRASKIEAKDKILSQILGTKPHTNVAIDFVRSLDDWKVAWDFIHFEGFLGTKMSMQFTWQGSDSSLAAPLVIDLARLAAHAVRCGETGPMKHLAFFFKDPLGATAHDLATQWQELVKHVRPPVVK